jgi:hypothetical protein
MELGFRENLRSIGDKCHAVRLGDVLVSGLSKRTRHWYGRHRCSASASEKCKTKGDGQDFQVGQCHYSAARRKTRTMRPEDLHYARRGRRVNPPVSERMHEIERRSLKELVGEREELKPPRPLQFVVAIDRYLQRRSEPLTSRRFRIVG